MKHSFLPVAIAMSLAATSSLSAFGLNYNASKSNTGNIVVHPSSVTEAQATAILAMIDKERQAPNQASIEEYLKVTGVKQGSIKSIIVEPNQGKTTVLLLADPSDEKNARGVANVTTSRSNTQHN
jgi:hypothetical protein